MEVSCNLCSDILGVGFPLHTPYSEDSSMLATNEMFEAPVGSEMNPRGCEPL